jgi:DNA-binding transcriptional LysR family regulator
VLAVELEPSVPPRVIALAWHRDRYQSRAVEVFVELASELCGMLEGSRRPATAAAG